ncbi:MAG: HEAT repeat domain-containing protein [Polyangiaceae bacterium]
MSAKQFVLRGVGIAALSVVLAGGFAGVTEQSSTAADAAGSASNELTRNLNTSDDFRVRVAAALALGKNKPAGALIALEAALSDPHPAVRGAATVALRALGDPAAIGPLARQMKRESAPATRAQMVASIEALHAKTAAVVAAPAVKYAVKLGNMRNLTKVRGDALGIVMEKAAKTQAAAIPGAVVVDDDLAASKINAPMIVLDGTITSMKQEPKLGGTVNFFAQVEFSVSKMPEHSLKVALTGGATSVGTQSSLVNAVRVNALQDQAIEGAVQSALNGCSNSGFEQAVK